MKLKKKHFFLTYKKNIFHRLRNIFNCVLLQKRRLTAGLIYNDFGDTYPMQTFYKIMVMKCSHLKPFLSILCMYHINVSVWQIIIQHFRWPMALHISLLSFLFTHVYSIQWPSPPYLDRKSCLFHNHIETEIKREKA